MPLDRFGCRLDFSYSSGPDGCWYRTSTVLEYWFQGFFVGGKVVRKEEEKKESDRKFTFFRTRNQGREFAARFAQDLLVISNFESLHIGFACQGP